MGTRNAPRAPLEFRSCQDEALRLAQQVPQPLELLLLLLERRLLFAAEALGFGETGEGGVALGGEGVRFERRDLGLKVGNLRRIALEHDGVGDELRKIGT